MSCEKNREAFLAHVAGAPQVAQPFGAQAVAAVGLETIFEAARSQAATGDALQQRLAEGKTRSLFAEMRAAGFTPPTHSSTGLPRPDAQFGYAALYDTLNALRNGRPLPALASRVVAAAGQTRQLSAQVFAEAAQRWRCGSCGRFIKPGGGGHLCPTTATPASFQRALVRRLGVPAGAYPPQALAALLDEARAGNIQLRHPITGETVETTLDGLPLAITQGFVPAAWAGKATLVEVSHGRIAPVLDAAGLTTIAPPADPIAAAAVASGAALPAGTPMVSATGGLPLMATVVAPTGTTPAISGGNRYDQRRFMGTEFRKGHGDVVIAGGKSYTVGDRSMDDADWGFARHHGIAPPPPTRPPFEGVAVGRTLVAAVEILRTGSWRARPDGVIEVFDNTGGLVSVFDPRTGMAADADGTLNASSAQMAAVLAARMLSRATALDDAFQQDMVAFIGGRGTALAASDGAYLTIKDQLSTGAPLILGGTLTAGQCPRCGKFMSADGCRACPPEVPAATAPAPVTPGATVVTPGPVASGPAPAIPPVTVQVEAPQVTVQVEAPQVTVQVDPPQITVPPPQVTVQIDPVLVPGAAADGSDAPPMVVSATASSDERMAELLDRIAARLERLDASNAAPAGAARNTPPAPAAPRLRPDRPVPPAGEQTEQERLVSGLRLPRPDPSLTALPPALRPAGFVAIDEDIPPVRKDYALNDRSRMILKRMANARALGIQMGRVNETRAFGIYGPPGTGKNEIARQFAASVVTVDADGNERQGMHLEQVEFDRDMDIGALIGTTALENGTTVARLGPIGLAAVQGAVVCLNEVVRNPKALTAFQSMLEEGEIRLKTPEGGIMKIPVHPSTTFLLTWNPGLEGDADRPAEAPRSRLVASFELPQATPKEQADRVKAFFSSAPVKPTEAEVNAAITFFGNLRNGIFRGDIQQRGRGSKAVPGPRDLNFFVMTGITEGWPAALDQLRIFGDQNQEDRERDWKFIEQQFAVSFGTDGKAVSRSAPSRS